MQIEPGLHPIQHGLGRSDLGLPDGSRGFDIDNHTMIRVERDPPARTHRIALVKLHVGVPSSPILPSITRIESAVQGSMKQSFFNKIRPDGFQRLRLMRS